MYFTQMQIFGRGMVSMAGKVERKYAGYLLLISGIRKLTTNSWQQPPLPLYIGTSPTAEVKAVWQTLPCL